MASSGLDEPGECIFRQIAQQAMGQFIFLLYESGDGTRTTPHDVGRQYWVNQLDKLIVRLIAEEIQRLHGKPEESTDACRVPDPDSNGEVIPNEAVVRLREPASTATANAVAATAAGTMADAITRGKEDSHHPLPIPHRRPPGQPRTR